jgi:hypothetical protein
MRGIPAVGLRADDFSGQSQLGGELLMRLRLWEQTSCTREDGKAASLRFAFALSCPLYGARLRGDGTNM